MSTLVGVSQRVAVDPRHGERRDALDQRWIAFLLSCGLTPIALPNHAPAVEALFAALQLAGVLLTGGNSLTTYGGDAPERDEAEALVLALSRRKGLPVLGVCRGMQVLAVHAGGTLEQHVPDLVGHEGHSPGGDEFGAVEVATTPGTRVAGLLGEQVTVNCHHHQSVGEHPGFVGAAHAADGTLEAIELAGDRFVVGVQWHPETAADVGLLAGLVRAAATYAQVR